MPPPIPQPTGAPALGATWQAFHSAHRLALEPALLTRPTGEILAANAAACEVFGADEGTLCALSRTRPGARLADMDDPRLAALIAERAAHGRARGRVRLRRADGSPFEAEVASHVFVDAQGDPATMMFVRDLTDRLEAERAARVSEQRLRFALDAARIGDWDMDLKTNVARRSLRHDQCFGYTEPLAEWGYDTFIAHVHRADRERVDACYRRAMAGEGEYDIEFRVVWPDGSLHWLWSKGRFYFDDAGHPVRVAGIQAEVTEHRGVVDALRRSEERLQLAMRGSSDAAWDLDLQTGEAHYSPRWLQMLGLDGVDVTMLDGQWWLQHVHPDDLARVRRIYAEAMSGNAETYEIEFRMRHREGHDVPILSRGYFLRDADGRALRVSGTNTDLTERQRLARAQQAQAVAESANRAKTEFLSRISHELRTPLNAVIGFAQLLRSDVRAPLSPSQGEQVVLVEQAGRHLLSLVEDVLDLSRIDAGNARLDIAPLAIVPLLRECADMLGGAAHDRRIDVALRTGADAHGLLGDHTRTRQIVLNLLSNAIKYAPAGSRVELAAVPDGPGQVAVTVRDEGPGLTAAQLARLFEPFDRLGREDSDVPGTGMGLAISRRLAELMGGDLSVHSTPGRGSAFTLRLPAAAVTPETDVPAAVVHPGPWPVDTRAGRRSVLYIEDNAANAELMRGICALRPRLDLRCVALGQAGVDAALGDPPDLVLLDWQLPDLPGAEVLRRLRAEPATAGTPVVVVSASVLPQTIDAARAGGAADFLPKPLALDAVLAALDRLVG